MPNKLHPDDDFFFLLLGSREAVGIDSADLHDARDKRVGVVVNANEKALSEFRILKNVKVREEEEEEEEEESEKRQ
ncbi:hypothetical protein T05_8881 [Trichinella murrelli]|uniref:Uncharacterized protein n=1 Tax=Trichinella murrelli TaxID=144512 RepID=A0A0V0U4P6_9BILA|nr:hypothetical protein T05_8881 [Trichinella murrelli]